jgi:hypothetical protein
VWGGENCEQKAFELIVNCEQKAFELIVNENIINKLLFFNSFKPAE